MSIRVHALAKELDLTSKELIEKLKTLGVTVKGHMTALDDETAEIMRHETAGKSEKTGKKETKPAIKKEAKIER
ncbi:MAG: translation initiation factor IF-2 N-terminal domain-containing protein, partial [Candidatus Omnitrophica bacterium]|nr:translation initiation factor IF-2 N-terminal domain-containing protein [Candidatus Omnitrophota bacterium]